MLNFNNGVNPLQTISDGYKERGKSNPNNDPASDSMQALRQRYETDAASMSPVELLTLGMYELSAKNVKDSEDKRIDEDKDAQKDDKGGGKDSEGKDKADTTESLQAKIDALQVKLAEIIGGANE
ncbi:hypothetical protein [Peribacillus frigoritolerans]|uniref:hypothetical protein n=1 Tax=Peribacillus frigoritolerans TaxID=450367 RepID=UPI003017EA2B